MEAQSTPLSVSEAVGYAEGLCDKKLRFWKS